MKRLTVGPRPEAIYKPDTRRPKTLAPSKTLSPSKDESLNPKGSWRVLPEDWESGFRFHSTRPAEALLPFACGLRFFV